MRYLYLHGFASGPQSRKARAFREAFAAEGIALEVPDLAAGDFEYLTIGGQLRVVTEALNGEAARLIGSSMGGYLAALYAASHPEIDRLILLAPAFGFVERWRELTGPEKLAEWRDSGWLGVFHYGENTERLVHYGLFEEAQRHAPNPGFHQPALIFHGVNDETVPVALSRAFAAAHANAQLIELDSDHELTAPLPRIVTESVPFLLNR